METKTVYEISMDTSTSSAATHNDSLDVDGNPDILCKQRKRRVQNLVEPNLVISKRYKTSRTSWLCLNDVAQGSDVLTAVLYPYLSLVDHFRLAYTCRTLLSAAGLPPPNPPPHVPRPAAWRKPVYLPNQITDVQLRKLVSYAKFADLKLGHEHTNSTLAQLFSLPLHTLDMSTCEVTDDGLAHLSSLPLHTLNISCCTQVTDAGLAHLSSLPLHTLDMSSCYEVTDDGLAHLSSLPLHTLNISFCIDYTDTGLAHLSSLPLHTLYMEGCTQVTDAGLAHLSSLPLQSLDMSHCTQVTNAGLAHLSSLPLHTLVVRRCRKVTDAGHAHLSSHPSVYV